MVNNDSKVVLFDSNEAAHFQTGLSGWVSRHGHFWGIDERAARYDGCTHTHCEDCGEPVDKGRLICPQCHENRQIKRYEAMPKEEWDGNGGLYSDAADKYFWDWDDIECYCEEDGIDEKDLRLVICVPQTLPLLSYDYGCDELPDDGELPDEVAKAIEDFNNIIKEVLATYRSLVMPNRYILTPKRVGGKGTWVLMGIRISNQIVEPKLGGINPKTKLCGLYTQGGISHQPLIIKEHWYCALRGSLSCCIFFSQTFHSSNHLWNLIKHWLCLLWLGFGQNGRRLLLIYEDLLIYSVIRQFEKISIAYMRIKPLAGGGGN